MRHLWTHFWVCLGACWIAEFLKTLSHLIFYNHRLWQPIFLLFGHRRLCTIFELTIIWNDKYVLIKIHTGNIMLMYLYTKKSFKMILYSILFQGSNINSKVGTGIGLGLSAFAWNYGGFCSFSVQDAGRFARSGPLNGGKSHSNFQEFQFCGRVGHASLLTGKDLLAITIRSFWGADTTHIHLRNWNIRH